MFKNGIGLLFFWFKIDCIWILDSKPYFIIFIKWYKYRPAHLWNKEDTIFCSVAKMGLQQYFDGQKIVS